ncbi:hypothetical protein [Microbulbifer pacificus]|uniref:FG-GAP repeat-containing protein n=1 Tax=Microbulbifer pacificus TaxID=407164 RepID=A0AAU0N0H4_9GAMM|nr:hypothetical protein [Microbulbifer pacificus]WOX06280.1 hypothetical protein R5R33_03910 [Microbulbifer pacificus]
MRILSVFICIFLFASLVAKNNAGDKGRDVEVANSLKEYGVASGTVYSIGFEDLNNDGDDEALVFLTGDWCGSGGCTLLVLSADSGKWNVISKVPTLRLPIYKLRETNDGWVDMSGVEYGGGELQKKYSRLSCSSENGYRKVGNIDDIDTIGKVLIVPEHPVFVSLE